MNNKKQYLTLTPILIPFLSIILLSLLSVSSRILEVQSSSAESISEKLLIITVLQIIVFLFPCITYYFLRGRKLNTPFMLTSFTTGYAVFTVASLLLLVFGNLLIKCFYYINAGSLPSGIDYLISDTSVLENASPLLVIITVALVPAVCEEIFFRGVVLAEYRLYGSFNAVLFSSICFAMIHFSVDAFPLYLFSGIVLGMSACISQTIIVPIIIHFISNLLSVFLSDSFLRVTVSKTGGFFAAFIVSALFLLSLVIFISRTEHIYDVRAVKETKPIIRKSLPNMHTVFLSPGFFGLVLVFILLIVFS